MNIHEVKRSNGVTRLYSVRVCCAGSPGIWNISHGWWCHYTTGVQAGDCSSSCLRSYNMCLGGTDDKPETFGCSRGSRTLCLRLWCRRLKQGLSSEEKTGPSAQWQDDVWIGVNVSWLLSQCLRWPLPEGKSTSMTKRNGARTSPCITPVETTKVSERFPSTISAVLELLYNTLILVLTTLWYSIVKQDCQNNVNVWKSC